MCSRMRGARGSSAGTRRSSAGERKVDFRDWKSPRSSPAEPPAELPAEWDDFAGLFFHGAAASVDWIPPAPDAVAPTATPEAAL